MTVRTAWLSFVATAAMVGVPALATRATPQLVPDTRRQGQGERGAGVRGRFRGVGQTGRQVAARPGARAVRQAPRGLHRRARSPHSRSRSAAPTIPTTSGRCPPTRTMGPDQKRELDLKLHQMVCDKTITLKAAQDADQEGLGQGLQPVRQGREITPPAGGRCISIGALWRTRRLGKRSRSAGPTIASSPPPAASLARTVWPPPASAASCTAPG